MPCSQKVCLPSSTDRICLYHSPCYKWILKAEYAAKLFVKKISIQIKLDDFKQKLKLTRAVKVESNTSLIYTYGFLAALCALKQNNTNLT